LGFVNTTAAREEVGAEGAGTDAPVAAVSPPATAPAPPPSPAPAPLAKPPPGTQAGADTRACALAMEVRGTEATLGTSPAPPPPLPPGPGAEAPRGTNTGMSLPTSPNADARDDVEAEAADEVEGATPAAGVGPVAPCATPPELGRVGATLLGAGPAPAAASWALALAGTKGAAVAGLYAGADPGAWKGALEGFSTPAPAPTPVVPAELALALALPRGTKGAAWAPMPACDAVGKECP
jgi:hypothetical protein